MASFIQQTEKKEYDYDGFLFKFLVNKKIPYWLMAILFVCVIFLIPKILMYEFGLGVSWTNIFYVSQEYMTAYDAFFSTRKGIYPGVDYLNLLGFIGIIIYIILNKGLYERLHDLKDFVLENLEPPYRHIYLESTRKREEKYMPHFIKTALRTFPLIAMVVVAIGVPTLDFLLFQDALPSLTFFYIQNYYGLVFVYSFTVCILAISIGAGVVIYGIGENHNVKTDMMHEDGVGGLKVYGRAAIHNLISWTVLAIIAMVSASVLVFSHIGQVERVIVDIVMISFLLFFTLLVFYLPLKAGHERLLREKKLELQKINKRTNNLLKVIEGGLDVGVISKESEEMVVDPTDLLVRLDFMAHSNYYTHVLRMREWPLDNNLIFKIIFSLVIPILFGIGSYYLESFI